MFTDSSKATAVAAVYLRVQDGDKYDVNLVAEKTSVFSEAEMARKSIPRKELIALDLGSRLLKKCISSTSLPIENFELWSDSKTVIQWCSEASLELKVFERNRVDSIRRSRQGKVPRYVPTHQNPADVATRPFKFYKHLAKWNLWTKGSQFLQQCCSTWMKYFSDVQISINACQLLSTVSDTSLNFFETHFR